jgi:hypothetical protein
MPYLFVPDHDGGAVLAEPTSTLVIPYTAIQIKSIYYTYKQGSIKRITDIEEPEGNLILSKNRMLQIE